MKKIIALVVLVAGTLLNANAQEKMSKMAPKTIALEQVKGAFTQKQLTIDEGTYIFEVFNNGVGHDVGLVLAPKGSDISNSENHIKTAYVTKAVATGEKERSKPTTLKKGEYVYFCPLNPTATDNTLIVK